MIRIRNFFLDLQTSDTTPLPKSLAGGGGYYTVTADGTRVAYGTCRCGASDVMTVANIDGTDARHGHLSYLNEVKGGRRGRVGLMVAAAHNSQGLRAPTIGHLSSPLCDHDGLVSARTVPTM